MQLSDDAGDDACSIEDIKIERVKIKRLLQGASCLSNDRMRVNRVSIPFIHKLVKRARVYS